MKGGENMSTNGFNFIVKHILDPGMKNPEYKNAVYRLSKLVDKPDEYNAALLDYSRGRAMYTQHI